MVAKCSSSMTAAMWFAAAASVCVRGQTCNQLHDTHEACSADSSVAEGELVVSLLQTPQASTELHSFRSHRDECPDGESLSPSVVCTDGNGIKSYAGIPNYWFGADPLANLGQLGSVQACAAACDAEADCAAFTRHRATGHCYLYEATNAACGIVTTVDDSYVKCGEGGSTKCVLDTDMFSFTKNSFYWFGADAVENLGKLGSLAACQDACEASGTCAGFTMHRATTHCYLYNASGVECGKQTTVDDSWMKCLPEW